MPTGRPESGEPGTCPVGSGPNLALASTILTRVRLESTQVMHELHATFVPAEGHARRFTADEIDLAANGSNVVGR